MNSTTESVGTSAHLSSVKELLAELDTMKNKGLGARERLDFILDQGAELVEEFDLQDAFDLEARARSKRIGQLDELSSVMTNAEHLWKGGPILEDVKEAADRLFGYLRRFLKDTFSRERKSEIDMLSQLWESAPDIRWMYPCLTAWEGPIYRPAYVGGQHGLNYPVAPSPEEPSEEVKELAKQKEKLYKEATPKAELERIAKDIELPDEEEQIKEMKKLWPDVPERAWVQAQEKVELEHKAELERLDKSVKEGSSSEQTQLEASEKKADWEKKARDFDQGRSSAWKGKLIREEASSVGRVVATMSNPVVESGPEQFAVDHILHDAWTTSLRELTLDDWQFTKEMPWDSGGRKGKVLLWHLQIGEARVEVNKTASGTNVSLRILKDGKLWKHEAELNDDEVRELHLNPIPFVKKALDD